jgi:PAS domain S-box-containing protein
MQPAMTTEDRKSLHLAAVVESSDDAIVSHDLDGTIQTWNRAAERMFGYPAANAIGQHVNLIIPPERRDEDRRMMIRLQGDAGASHFETLALSSSGARVPISLTVSPVVTRDGDIIGMSRTARDISRHRELEQLSFRLAAIVDSSDDAIVSKDLNGIVQTWNRAAERMFGYTAAEMIGRPITVIIPVERHAEEDSVLSRIRAGVSVDHFETVRQRKDGSRIEISLTVSPIKSPAGVVIGASKIARDITVQRNLARAAEQANRVKDEFLAMLSHELRTPLNAVLGYTRMLRQGNVDERRQERAIDIIERNATVLSQLVSDVLDVSSIVTGKVRLSMQPHDLVQVVGAALDVVRPSAEAKGVALRFETADAALRIRGDADRLQQVFWNLLTNGVKFTPRGGRIDVHLTSADGTAEVVVRDSGAGITPESLPFVFQRFWQAEHVASRHPGGLGLGLALARHFVELHGGTIAAMSGGEGQGATFTVTLPIHGD